MKVTVDLYVGVLGMRLVHAMQVAYLCRELPRPGTFLGRFRCPSMLVAVLIWLVLAIVIGVAGAHRGRSGLGWLFLSLILSPLVAAIVLALLPDRRYAEVRSRLTACEAATILTADVRDLTRPKSIKFD